MELQSREAEAARLTIFAYCQRIDGFPVENTVARLVTRNGEESIVVMASGKFVSPPLGGFAPVFVTAAAALELVSLISEYADLSEFASPQLVAFANPDEYSPDDPFASSPVLTWKFFASNPDSLRAFTFFVNAESGEIAQVRNEVFASDVTGTVRGYATPWGPNAATPDWPGNPPTSQPIGYVRVSIPGGLFGYADATGNFSIGPPFPPTITVEASVSDGLFANIADPEGIGAPLSVSAPAVPGVPIELVLNATPTPLATAQVNAMVHMNRTHDFLATYSPSFIAMLNQSMRATVNMTLSACNASFADTEFRFGAGGCGPTGGCWNWAFSSVIAHEYGHYVVSQLGLANADFGEGFADSLSLISLDECMFARGIGRDPATCMESLGSTRNYCPGEPEGKYPCPAIGGIDQQYVCGAVLAGFWVDILEAYRADGDPATDLPQVQDLFRAWALVTMGGFGRNHAHPLTVVEILTVDDDDGNLANGTPHSAQICAAAARHKLAITIPGSSTCSVGPPGTNENVSFYSPIRTLSSESGLTGVDPFGIAAGSLNPVGPQGDSLNDVVLACELGDQIQVYLALPAPPPNPYGFAAPVVIPLAAGSLPAKVVLADMTVGAATPDGFLDVIVTLQGSNAVQIFLNDGQGQFTSTPPLSLAGAPGGTVFRPIGLVVGNWDGVNGNDIAVAGYQVDAGSVEHPALGLLWSQPGGGFSLGATSVTEIGRGYDLVGWSDGAGLPARLALTNELPVSGQTNYVHTFGFEAPNSFSLQQSLDSQDSSRGIAIGNLTVAGSADGVLDLVCTTFKPPPPATGGLNSVFWYPQLVGGSFENDPLTIPIRRQQLNPAVQPVGIATGKLGKRDTLPLSLEPKIDLVVAAPTPVHGFTKLFVFRAIGSSFPSDPAYQSLPFPVTMLIAEPATPRQVLVFDMNADGFPDILSSNRGAPAADDAAEGFSLLVNRH